MSSTTTTPPRRSRSARLRSYVVGLGDAGAGRLVSRFVGRAKELELFIGATSEDPRTAARIVGVSGVPGVGKSRFVEEALARLMHAGRPVTTVRPALYPGMDRVAWLRAFAAELRIGGPMLSSAVSRLAQAPTARLDESSARALVNALFHESYDAGVERRGFIRPKLQRLAIVLDSFDLLPGEIVRWLADSFLPLLHEARGHLDYVLVLVGEHSLASSLDPVAWNAQPMRFLSIEILPLSEAESVELLASFARRVEEARTLHSLGEGVPAAMLELLRHRVAPLPEIGAALDRCSELQAETLLAIAGLGVGTVEVLGIVLGDSGKAGAEALQTPTLGIPVFGSLRAGGLWLPGTIVRLVQEKFADRFPKILQRAGEVAEMLETLSQYFATAEDRATAAQLVGLRHFSVPLLRTCFGAEEGDRLGRFVVAHPGAYLTTAAENLRLLEELRPLLEKYAESGPEAARTALHTKLSKLWAERSAELESELERAGGLLKNMEHERDELLKELETARSRVVDSEEENHREWRMRIDSNVVRIGTSLAANALGVVAFWVALFTDGQRLTFLILGAVLIGIGIGTPAIGGGRAQGRGERAVREALEAVRRRQLARVDEAQGAVNLLEARLNALQERLATERRKVERLRAAAHEPYV